MRLRTVLAMAALAAAAFAMPAQAEEGDAAAGKKVYNKCKACHDAVAEKNKVGPHLVGIFGRAAGAVEGYKYSKALLAKAEEGLVWDEESFTEYVKNPKGFIPKGKMAFAGLKKDEDVVNLIAYMKADPKP